VPRAGSNELNLSAKQDSTQSTAISWADLAGHSTDKSE
jgi:hypothetical protein